MTASVPSEIFKAYDIRGLYGEQIDGEIAERIGRAFAHVLSELESKPIGDLRVGLGRDMRLSAPELAARLMYLAGIGDGGALERAVERGEHAPFDEVEGRRLAVARARQVAGNLLICAPGMRAHHHDPVGQHNGLLHVVCHHDQRRFRISAKIEQMILQVGAGKGIEG